MTARGASVAWAAIEAELATLGNPPIFACALRDDLLRRARAGDDGARETLFKAVPPDLPAATCRAERDRRILGLHQHLHQALPDAAPTVLDAMLAAAGERVAGGERLEREPFDTLSEADRARLLTEVRFILGWAEWPGARQIANVRKKATSEI